MQDVSLDRRRLLAAMIFVSGAGIVPLLPLSRAWAAGLDAGDPAGRAALLRVARELFPHDALPDAAYLAVLDQVLADVASGVAAEDVMAMLEARAGADWPDLDAAALDTALRSVEAEPAFLAVENTVRAGLYNGAAFWAYVGYPGPSKDFGGYLQRGAGRVDWLAGES